MALSEEKLCSVGCKWMYTFNCLEAKKFIPVINFASLFIRRIGRLDHAPPEPAAKLLDWYTCHGSPS